MTTEPRPLFVYVTLCAPEFLATILGEPSDKIPRMLQAATVKGYERRSKYFGSGFALQPAAIESEDPEATIEGYLLTLETRSQRRKLDNFEAEGEAHKSVSVQVHISATGQTVTADMYLWNGPMGEISPEPWDLDAFIRDGLEDFLAVFEGMEFDGVEEQ
ncbi:hypothetical protein QBC40DRAFT_51140 [Triangularia verruculosa]|uniref:Putative gamma-glutamylcyclotransferase n=1 Tax=Triangularia verruculosa TaxID=2587418 RepID=A0AAN6XTR7_9PEZI|nr:hypothetical protein QBC40DRAFT_51140 [Triangularia verruculosa]